MLVTQKDATKDNPEADDLYRVGMVCMVMRTLKLPDGRLKVLVQAMSKARIKDSVQKEPFYQVTIEVIEELEVQEITVEIEALMRTVREQTEKIMSLRGILSADLMMIINNIEEPGRLADLVGSNLRLKIAESQPILEDDRSGQSVSSWSTDLLHEGTGGLDGPGQDPERRQGGDEQVPARVFPARAAACPAEGTRRYRRRLPRRSRSSSAS